MDPKINLKDNEIKFLQLLCRELTIKQIADQMCKSVRTAEAYSQKLYARLNCISRTGLVIFAIKNGIVEIENL